jgi:hypothetical protein
MRIPLLCCVLMTAAAGCRSGEKDRPSNPSTPGPSEAERVVQRGADADNRHDLEGLVAVFAPDARVYRFPDQLLTNSRDTVRARFRKMFADEPNGHVVISPRIVWGRFVVDRETITRLKSGKPDSALWIYEVQGGQIVRAWVVPE